jgi:hypothetical protein
MVKICIKIERSFIVFITVVFICQASVIFKKRKYRFLALSRVTESDQDSNREKKSEIPSHHSNHLGEVTFF